jgi:hypothetical protein
MNESMTVLATTTFVTPDRLTVDNANLPPNPTQHSTPARSGCQLVSPRIEKTLWLFPSVLPIIPGAT